MALMEYMIKYGEGKKIKERKNERCSG